MYEEVASHPRTRHTPIVVVTGDPGDLREKKFLCILRKPVDLDSLITTVVRCFPPPRVRKKKKR